MLSIYRLPNQLPEEKIIKIVRRDAFILLKRILLFLFLIIMPLIVFYFLIMVQTSELFGPAGFPLLVLAASAYYLFTWLFFFFTFIDYYLDVWIVTNERIIDIEQQGFFSRVIAEQKLFRIQDVTSEVRGIFQTMVRFGDVYVQTAGSKERFHFDDVSNPDEVRDLIIKLVERKKLEAQAEEK